MQLHVRLDADGAQVHDIINQVTTPEDQEKVARVVATTVKRWLRTIPVRNNGSRCRFDVYAWWTFGAERAERKTKKSKKAKAEAADGG